MRRLLRLTLLSLAALCASAAMGLGAYLVWFHLMRPQPRPTRQRLFAGVVYQRDVQASPPLVQHLVRIDLTTPGLRFLVTPHTGGRFRASTVSNFLRRHRLQLAINGDFFHPFHSRHPWDYYPHEGDPVRVFGLSCSARRCNNRRSRNRPTLYIDCDGRPGFRRPAQVCHAVSGLRLLARGKVHPGLIPGGRHPRTALAMDRLERTLLLLVVDGRQPGYSDGVTPSELARLMLSAGGYNGINLDGGGSSALVVERDGHAVQLNAPIHTRLVGRERLVANHLGLWAPR